MTLLVLFWPAPEPMPLPCADHVVDAPQASHLGSRPACRGRPETSFLHHCGRTSGRWPFRTHLPAALAGTSATRSQSPVCWLPFPTVRAPVASRDCRPRSEFVALLRWWARRRERLLTLASRHTGLRSVMVRKTLLGSGGSGVGGLVVPLTSAAAKRLRLMRSQPAQDLRPRRVHLQCSSDRTRQRASSRLSGTDVNQRLSASRAFVRPAALSSRGSNDSGSQRGRSVESAGRWDNARSLAPDLYPDLGRKHVEAQGHAALLAPVSKRPWFAAASIPPACRVKVFRVALNPSNSRPDFMQKPRQLSHCHVVIRNAPDVGYRHYQTAPSAYRLLARVLLARRRRGTSERRSLSACLFPPLFSGGRCPLFVAAVGVLQRGIKFSAGRHVLPVRPPARASDMPPLPHR